jgi:hypothetical protein
VESGEIGKIQEQSTRPSENYGRGHVSRGWGLAEILLDSDVIIAWLRGYNPFTKILPGLLVRGEVLAWTPVSVAEIFAGARKAEEGQLQNLNDRSFLLRDGQHGPENSRNSHLQDSPKRRPDRQTGQLTFVLGDNI